MVSADFVWAYHGRLQYKEGEHVKYAEQHHVALSSRSRPGALALRGHAHLFTISNPYVCTRLPIFICRRGCCGIDNVILCQYIWFFSMWTISYVQCTNTKIHVCFSLLGIHKTAALERWSRWIILQNHSDWWYDMLRMYFSFTKTHLTHHLL